MTSPRPIAAALCAVLFSLTAADASAQDTPPAATEPAPAQAEPAPVPVYEAMLAPLTRDRVYRQSEVGVYVVDVDSGEVMFDREGHTGFVPASTMKVLTAATALDRLGPSYRFTTELLTDGELDGAGVLHGNLYVRGTGDPSLVIEDLWKLVVDLRLEGVEQVNGDVVFDEDFFGADHALPGWDKPEDVARGPSYFPKLSALSLTFNTAAVVVGPGPEVGGPARAVLETPIVGDVVKVDNQAVTGAAGSRRRLLIERTVEGSTMTLTVSGSVPADSEADRSYRTVPDPTEYFIAVFRQLENAQGVRVVGRHRLGSTPRDAEMVVQRRSPPLPVLLADMNKYSNNFIAEQVLRAVGAEASGLPGTTEKGVAAVEEFLAEIGAPVEPGMLVNGSGLSRDARLTPAHLTTVLAHMADDWQVGAEFVSSLSIAGRDGTLWRRLRDEPGRMRGKTGTLDGVHCLAGYLTDASGERFAFAFLVNDLEGGTSGARRLHDRFARSVLEAGADDVSLADGDAR